MKKIVLLGTALAFTAQADDGAVSGKSAFEGFYAGLGLCYMHSDNELKITDGDIDGDGTINQYNLKIHDKKGNHFGGSLVAGYGRFISDSKFYLGGEIMLDIASNKSTDGNYDVGAAGIYVRYPYRSKVRGFVPSIAIRLGGWVCPIDSILYVKVSGALVQAEYQEKDNELNTDKRKINKVAPVVGLGIEKHIYNNWNLRFEGDYKFRIQKTTKTRDNADNNIHWNVKNRLSGFSLRLMATYKF